MIEDSELDSGMWIKVGLTKVRIGAHIWWCVGVCVCVFVGGLRSLLAFVHMQNSLYSTVYSIFN